MSFALRQAICGIVSKPPGVSNLREDAATRGTEAENHIAVLIHRYAAHPTPGRIWLVGALLKENRCRRYRTYFKPANACNTACTNGKVSHGGFVPITEFSIAQSEHQAIADAIEIVW